MLHSSKNTHINESQLHRKYAFEDFTKASIRSEFFKELVVNNRASRHLFRFILHIIMFSFFLFSTAWIFDHSIFIGIFIYPVFLFLQGLIISGFMIHSHELSHNHINHKLLNDLVGIVSGLVSFINFYSFQYAHRIHHRNIGNLDTPEAGAPVSATGQKKIRNHDKPKKLIYSISSRSAILWILTSWPIFIYYGDYSSWLRPYQAGGRIDRRSIAVFFAFILINSLLILMFPLEYLFLYLLPVLIGGSRILAITYLHHAHRDCIYFNEKHHNFFNVILSTTDRDYGPIVNFFMMNNGYHIPHHMNPHIAYYDLKRASQYLRSTLPEGLTYNFYDKCRLFRDLSQSLYEQRLDQDYDFYQIPHSSYASKQYISPGRKGVINYA